MESRAEEQRYEVPTISSNHIKDPDLGSLLSFLTLQSFKEKWQKQIQSACSDALQHWLLLPEIVPPHRFTIHKNPLQILGHE